MKGATGGMFYDDDDPIAYDDKSRAYRPERVGYYDEEADDLRDAQGEPEEESQEDWEEAERLNACIEENERAGYAPEYEPPWNEEHEKWRSDMLETQAKLIEGVDHARAGNVCQAVWELPELKPDGSHYMARCGEPLPPYKGVGRKPKFCPLHTESDRKRRQADRKRPDRKRRQRRSKTD